MYLDDPQERGETLRLRVILRVPFFLEICDRTENEIFNQSAVYKLRKF